MQNILYTLDKAILTEVAKNDYWYVHDCVHQQRCLGHEPDRPGTAHKEAEKSVDDADIKRITVSAVLLWLHSTIANKPEQVVYQQVVM